MVTASETTPNAAYLHERLVQTACAQANGQAVEVYRLDSAIDLLSHHLPGEDAGQRPTPLEVNLDELAGQRDQLLAKSVELQSASLRQLHQLSPGLSNETYFGSAALFTSLNPYLFAQAHEFSAQTAELVSQLTLGKSFLAWGERDGGEYGMYGGRIVDLRRAYGLDSHTGDPNLGIEVVFQPQNTAENQGPIIVRRTVQQLIDSRDPDNRLRPNWYAGFGQILGLARPLFTPGHVRMKEEAVEMPAHIENLARYTIAAWAAGIDLFGTAAFSIADQDVIVERLSELHNTTKQGWQRRLASNALKALGELTPELRRSI